MGLTWHASARRFAELFWPGPLTLVLSDAEGAFPSGVRSAEGAVAVRVSSGPFVKGLLASLGAPITSTSANPPGGRPALSGSEALEAARSLGAGEELWVNRRRPGEGSGSIHHCGLHWSAARPDT